MKPALLPGLAPPRDGHVDLLIVAGEHSGDEHGARLVRALSARQPALKVCALGGPALAAAGAQLLHDLTASSVVGFVEVLRHYPFFKSLFGATLRWIGQHRPRAVCFIDYPGFNLRLAAQLRARGLSGKGGGGIRTLYYISPQIWAWKPKRRFAMARDLDALAVIFPFEPACYSHTGLPVEFVGHPFVAADYVPPVRHDPSGPVLLLPGSRVQAVGRIFPVLLGTIAVFRGRNAVALYPSEEIRVLLAGLVAAAGLGARVELRPVGSSVAAAAVLTSSGTMSLHCALAGIPGAIVYRTNPLTYLLARWWVKLEYIGIANLLLQAPMYREFIQDSARPVALARELRACVEDSTKLEQTRIQAVKLRALLTQPSNGTAADWLVRQLPNRPRA